MNLMVVVCLFGIVQCGAIAVDAAELSPTASASYVSLSVQALAGQLAASGARGPDLEARISGLPATTDIGDLTEALLLDGNDVFSVVRDTILARGKQGDAPAVAAAVATRALLVKGPTARPLIDAGVLAAAAEMERRRRAAPVLAVRAGGDEVQAQAVRDRERERLERMMRKGLIDDVYRDYVEEKRRQVEQAVPPPGPDLSYADVDVAVYQSLFIAGLAGDGYFDPDIEIGSDAGGTASGQ
jgi:hypothetical protein